MLNVILAIDSTNGLGKNNKLAWRIPEELRLFKKKTYNSVLISGRKTCDHLPTLKDRIIFCVSRGYKAVTSDRNMLRCFSSIETALEEAKNMNKEIYIIGGNEVYSYVFQNFKKEDIVVHLSILKNTYDCDTFFNRDLLKDFYICKETINDEFVHYEMVYQKLGEFQYLNIVKDILVNGDGRTGRNGEIVSEFAKHLKFDLRDGFPLLTTKKMFTKGIIEELLFFIRGDTNSKLLEEKGINIWKGNTCREFLDSNGFAYRKEGEMGPMYGFQWRTFNKFYGDGVNIVNNNEFFGIDQLKNVINEIKDNPTSRRILMITYNPTQVHLGVLYPCHSIIIQFYVQNEFLDMFCYNRSSDIGLGLPFNIASSSLLLEIIAKLTCKTARYFNLTLGDAHIYSEHEASLLEQAGRIPYIFPKIQLPEFSTLEDVEGLTYKDFKIEGYISHGTLKMLMKA